MATTMKRYRRWEHDEGMDYGTAITDAVRDISPRVHDYGPSGWKPQIQYAHPGSTVFVTMDLTSVESVELTYETPDLHGATMTATLTKVEPATVAQFIIAALKHGM